MFKEVFLFELKNGFRRPATYIFFGVLFLFTLMLGLAAAGVFATTRNDSNLFMNSAISVAGILLGSSGSIFSLLVSILLISIIATAIQKDYQYNSHPMFFTKPITKPGYFFGRFLGALIVALFVFSGLLLGYFAGTLFGAGKLFMGPYNPLNYLQPFIIFTMPNIILLGVIFFSLTTFLRNTFPAYIVAITLLVLQLAASTITEKIDNKELAALLEPSGEVALKFVTEYWTPQEKNTNLIPFNGAIFYNRLLWTGISILVLMVSYFGFSFSQFLQPFRLFKRKPDAPPAVLSSSHSLTHLPKAGQIFNGKTRIMQLWKLTIAEFKKMVKSLFFIIMCILGIGMMLLIVNFMDMIYETPTYLVTYKVLENVAGSFSLFALIYVIFYSGTAIWRERDSKMDELMGVVPVSNAHFFFSKFLGLTFALIVLYLVAALAGIILQLQSGYYNIDLSQYFVFLVRNLAYGIVVIGLCLAIQVYSPNKFLGFFFSLIPIMIIPIVFGLLEWNNPLYDFNDNGPSNPYSDMNGYGGTFNQWFFFRAYWISFIAILCLLALLLYPRGKEKSLKSRWNLSKYFYSTPYKMLAGFFLLIFIGAGFFIYYQTRILQDYKKPKVNERQTAELEKKYKKYERLNQPRIVSSTVAVNIFPKSKKLHIAGTYVLLNKTNSPIDTLFLEYNGGKKNPYSYKKFDVSVPFMVLEDDRFYGIKILKLQQALLPGDSITFEYDMSYVPRGLFDRMNSPVMDNGTFINSSLLPSVGYNEKAELRQNRARKEYGLPPKRRLARVDDSVARMNNYISNDADWIRFEAVISTDEDQIAIAPGYLQKEWTKDGRRYFHYKMDSPILNFYSFLSARYIVKKDKWNDVNIEIYYHKGHEYNLDRMIKAIKRSLDYYTVNFSPYQHRQVRIIEFPRYASFAQSFPNTIPYSEAVGFITKVEDGKDKIDIPFYVTSHEVAHQWWAHQVIGGNVQGSELMSESMSQYGALMVMEKEYGTASMKRFLKDEMNKYLRGRAMEAKGELPLMLCENQSYIHYNKGSIILYALKDFIGEDTLNAAVRAYLRKNQYYGPMYTNSVEFVNYLRNATPDSLKYLISDMFEKITLYENYVKAFDVKKQADNSYKVTLTVGSVKFYSDSVGKQAKAKVNDYMDIGIFATQHFKEKEEETPLVLQRIKMDQPVKTFVFIVKEKPVGAGIDPYLKLIDRTPKNNTLKFGQTPEKVNLDPGKPGVMVTFGKEDD